ECLRPFDLARGPLVRASLVRLAEDEHVLFMNFHHIVFDGWSFGVFAGELAAQYFAFAEGRPAALPELPVQYADFPVSQLQPLQGDRLLSDLRYGNGQLGGEPSRVQLPTG